MSGRVLNAKLPCPLPVKSGYVTILAYQHVNQLRSSAELWRPGFYCDFITSACLIKSLTLCLNSAPSLLSSCWSGQRSLPFNHLLGPSGDQHHSEATRASTISHLISITKILLSLRKFQGF